MTASGYAEKGRSATTTATLDEAMLLTGFGIYNVLHTLMSGTVLMGVITQSISLGYVMPAAQCDLGLSTQQKGWLAAIPFVAIILTSHMWGWLADTRGRRPVMLISMLLSVILTVVTSFAPDLTSFAVIYFFASVFMSGPSAVVYTYLGEFNSVRHRDKMVAFGASFVGIGTVLLPCISWLILPLDFAFPIPFLGIHYRSWRLLVVACAVPYAIGTVLLLFAQESPKFLSATGQQDACLAVVRKIYAVNKRTTEDNFPVNTLIVENQTTPLNTKKGVSAVLASMRDQTVPLFKPPLLSSTCLTCFVQFGIFAACNGFYVWFPTILNSLANHEGGPATICDVLDTSRTVVNGTAVECVDTINASTFERSIYVGLVFCSMYLVVGFLVDLVGKRMILVAILGTAGACGIGAHFPTNEQLAVVLFAVFQMSGACIGLMNAVAVELFPTKFRAMALCLSMMMGRVGSVVGSNLIGMLLELNCGVGFYLFGGLLLVCSSLCFTLPSKKTAKPAKQVMSEPRQNESHEPA